MDFKAFIITKIESLSKEFHNLNLRAEENKLSGYYFIEITPLTEFRSNSVLAKRINEIYIEQIEKYPSESLAFITIDSYYKITNPFLTIAAKPYEVTYKKFNVSLDLLFRMYHPVFYNKLMGNLEKFTYYGIENEFKNTNSDNTPTYLIASHSSALRNKHSSKERNYTVYG